MRINFKITNITCEACVKLSNLALKNIPEATAAKVDKNGNAFIESEREISKEEIIKAMEEAGKTVSF